MLGFWMHWTSSRASPAAERVRLAAEHASRAGERALRSRALGWYVATLIFGPADVVSLERELEAIEHQGPGPYLQSFVDLGHSEAHRLRGDVEAAVAIASRARDGFRALGMSTLAAACEQTLGWIQLSIGDAAAARVALLRSDAILGELGERAFRSTTQALLARAAESLGQAEEADAALRRAESLSSPSDVVNFSITHEVRARLALTAGEAERAEHWARSSLYHALQTDFVTYQAQAHLGLARVLLACAQAEQARAQAQAAAELFLAKGDQPGAASAQAFLVQVEG
jgi:tetratricopeptide (TPR) repeat protein